MHRPAAAPNAAPAHFQLRERKFHAYAAGAHSLVQPLGEEAWINFHLRGPKLPPPGTRTGICLKAKPGCNQKGGLLPGAKLNDYSAKDGGRAVHTRTGFGATLARHGSGD